MATHHTPPVLDDGWLLVFLDVLLILVLVLAALVNPPRTTNEDFRPGTISVEIRWPDRCGDDIDLWVKAPGDRPVGYSNPSGKVFNLLRDDLGVSADLSGLNFEIAYTRGLPAGEYIVNVHYYRASGPCAAPIPVEFRITSRRGKIVALVRSGTAHLRIGEEATLARFTFNDDGRLVGPVDDLPIGLRSWSG